MIDSIVSVPAAPVIETLTLADETAAVTAFLAQARRETFPWLDGTPLPADLADFRGRYLHDPRAQFVVARVGAEVVGGIGYLPYDHRFAQLDYRGQAAVEVVRLFVAPAWRRNGLASRLYQALRDLALENQVTLLYLHTHPFLPGAIGFWERQGFVITDVEDDPVWHTTHMEWRCDYAEVAGGSSS